MFSVKLVPPPHHCKLTEPVPEPLAFKKEKCSSLVEH